MMINDCAGHQEMQGYSPYVSGLSGGDRSVLQPKVSRYRLDDCDRPRILSNLEDTLHRLARPVLFAIGLDFALAISIGALSHFSTSHLQETALRLTTDR